MRRREHEEDPDEKIVRILSDLSPREKERLMAAVAVGMEPKRLIAPLTERLIEVFQEHTEHELSPQQAREIARLALVENMGARQTHLSQLAQLLQDVEKQKGAGDPRVLSRRILDFCRASGLRKVTDTEDLSRYRVIAGHPGPDTTAKVVAPAFVDEISGRLIVSGEIRFQEAKTEKNSRGRA